MDVAAMQSFSGKLREWLPHKLLNYSGKTPTILTLEQTGDTVQP